MWFGYFVFDLTASGLVDWAACLNRRGKCWREALASPTLNWPNYLVEALKEPPSICTFILLEVLHAEDSSISSYFERLVAYVLWFLKILWRMSCVPSLSSRPWSTWSVITTCCPVFTRIYTGDSLQYVLSVCCMERPPFHHQPKAVSS
jgi:hypothetical protein